MANKITPVILTFNERENIGRLLDALTWAERVVVVDSYSTDDTTKIAESYPNVVVLFRRFDTHSQQWNFAVSCSEVLGDWVLALDADYILSEDLVKELHALDFENADIIGYEAKFKYCINGIVIGESLYPPVTVLFNRRYARYKQDGHTQRLILTGEKAYLRGRIYHDDRKPLARWLLSQEKYMELEVDHIQNATRNTKPLSDRVRRYYYVSPFIVLFYVLILKKQIFSGKAGMIYALQRFIAELILSYKMAERDLKKKS